MKYYGSVCYYTEIRENFVLSVLVFLADRNGIVHASITQIKQCLIDCKIFKNDKNKNYNYNSILLSKILRSLQDQKLINKQRFTGKTLQNQQPDSHFGYKILDRNTIEKRLLDMPQFPATYKKLMKKLHNIPVTVQ